MINAIIIFICLIIALVCFEKLFELFIGMFCTPFQFMLLAVGLFLLFLSYTPKSSRPKGDKKLLEKKLKVLENLKNIKSQILSYVETDDVLKDYLDRINFYDNIEVFDNFNISEANSEINLARLKRSSNFETYNSLLKTYEKQINNIRKIEKARLKNLVDGELKKISKSDDKFFIAKVNVFLDTKKLNFDLPDYVKGYFILLDNCEYVLPVYIDEKKYDMGKLENNFIIGKNYRYYKIYQENKVRLNKLNDILNSISDLTIIPIYVKNQIVNLANEILYNLPNNGEGKVEMRATKIIAYEDYYDIMYLEKSNHAVISFNKGISSYIDEINFNSIKIKDSEAIALLDTIMPEKRK